MTPLRRELMQAIVGDRLGTYEELLSNEMVEVPTLDGSFIQTQAHEVSGT